MRYQPGMDLNKYLERYRYFPKLTDFIFGELAYKIRCRGYLEREDFVLILLWKTQLFQIDMEKGQWKTGFGEEDRQFFFEPDAEKIRTCTEKIFRINHFDKTEVARIIGELDGLRGVGYKVATTILAVVYPDFYGIVDRHVERALDMRVSGDICEDCVSIMFRMREIAEEQMPKSRRYWTPRMVDMALWVLDKEV